MITHCGGRLKPQHVHRPHEAQTKPRICHSEQREESVIQSKKSEISHMQLPGGQTPPLRVLNCVMFFPVPHAPSLREGPGRGSLLQYSNSLRYARPYLAKEGQLLMQCPHNTRKKTPTVGARSASPIQAPQRRYSQTPSATLVPLPKEGQLFVRAR